MTIKREYGNELKIEIELTAEEVRSIYEEQEHIYDMEDIKGELENRVEIDKDETADVILQNKDMVSDIAHEKRRLMDKYNLDWEEATRKSINDAVGRLETANWKDYLN